MSDRCGIGKCATNLDELVEAFLAHRGLMQRVVSRFVKSQEIDDIVQEAFLRSYAAAQKQTVHDPRSFMLTTAKNLARNFNSRSDNRLNRSIDAFDAEEMLRERQTPESIHESQQEFLAFCQAVANLPRGCRRVFIMRKVYGLSYEEIAAALEISVKTVGNQISKGMLSTSQYLLESGYAVAKDRRRRGGGGTNEGQHS